MHSIRPNSMLPELCFLGFWLVLRLKRRVELRYLLLTVLTTLVAMLVGQY